MDCVHTLLPLRDLLFFFLHLLSLLLGFHVLCNFASDISVCSLRALPSFLLRSSSLLDILYRFANYLGLVVLFDVLVVDFGILAQHGLAFIERLLMAEGIVTVALSGRSRALLAWQFLLWAEILL